MIPRSRFVLEPASTVRPTSKMRGGIFLRKKKFTLKNRIRWTNSMDYFTYLRYNIKKVKLWDLIFKTEGTRAVSKN